MPYAFVQDSEGSGGSGSVTTRAATDKAFASAHVSGNSFLWEVQYDGAASPVAVTMSDTRGNTYVEVGSFHNASDQNGRVWGYVANTVAGAATVVTATFASAVTFPAVYVGEYSGLDTSAIFTVGEVASNRQSAPGSAANALTSTNTPTLASQPAMLWAVSHDWTAGTDTPAVGTGLTSRATIWGFPGTGVAARVADRRLTATTAVAATFTATTGANIFYTTAMVVKESTTGAPPTITVQPVDDREPVGGTANFSVTATGGTLSYQWKLNGTNVGTNSSSYARSGLVIGDNGTVTVDVTDANGTTTSNNASLTVYPTGQLLYRYPLPPRQGPNYGQARRIAQGGQFNTREGLVTLQGRVGSTAAAYLIRLAETFTPAAGGGTTFLNLAFTALGTLARQREIRVAKALSGIGTLSRQRQLNKFTSYSAVGTSTEQKQVNKLLAYAAVGTLVASRLFVKILSFAYSGVGSATVQKQVNKFAAFTAVGANAVQKRINKSLVYSAVGSTATQKQVNKALAYTATGTLALTFLLVKLLAFSYTATGTLTKAILAVIGRAFTYTALGTVALQKQIGKSFSYVSVGTSTVVKQVQKVLSYSGVGTLTFARAASMAKAFVYSAVGTLTTSRTFFGGGGPVVRAVAKATRFINNRFGGR